MRILHDLLRCPVADARMQSAVVVERLDVTRVRRIPA
jgi:hypothetical protein